MMETMLCPVCTSPLYVFASERLETLEEHVSDPDGEISLKDAYKCSNKECVTHTAGVRWNEFGELYSKHIDLTIPYINDNNAPFGSSQRKYNVEIYKHDEDFDIVGFTLNNERYALRIEYEYKSDNEGRIHKRTPHLKLIWRGAYHIGGLRMIKYDLTRIDLNLFELWSTISIAGKRKIIRRIYEDYARRFQRDEWWRKANRLYLRLRYNRILIIGQWLSKRRYK